RRLFLKPAPGWHGKGAYTGQGRLVIANNGESSAAGDVKGEWELPADAWPRGPEDAGALAQFDGQAWELIRRRQFVEVTGPGGIAGALADDDPVWAMGWDARSVLLMVLENGKWKTFRLPKCSHAMDPRHGWYTEWPRIRAVSDDEALICMHGGLFEMPLSFSASHLCGIRPLASHLRYIPDFCVWNDRLVLAADDTSIMQNPMAGQSQSNLWFGSLDDVKSWGPGGAQGGPWLGDDVEADTPSDPFLFAGFADRMVHLAAAGGQPVEVAVEIDEQGDGAWRTLLTLTIGASGYLSHIFADDVPGEWIRFRTNRTARISAYLHYARAASRVPHTPDARLFAGLLAANADAGATGPRIVVRPAAHNRNLQAIVLNEGDDDIAAFEVDETLAVRRAPADKNVEKATELLRLSPQVEYDAASAIVVGMDGRRLRLPVVEGTVPWGRDIREVQSERSLANIGNIFYEIPRGDQNKEQLDTRHLRPIAAHRFAIDDFCSWRGMLVLAGAKAAAAGDGHVVALPDVDAGLWFGCVDDLWKLGKPVGVGGPWRDAQVKADEPSDPYLMTGFDRKSVAISHDSNESVQFRIEIDYSNRDFWKPYATVDAPPGKTTRFEFPPGYSAHWVRLIADRACRATAVFRYE
ncbi:MAG: hypothetical protein KDA41_15060, partial [Planctomycetales bacterium]|nr:hypothetical protein [Planctomycetales bacterium]